MTTDLNKLKEEWNNTIIEKYKELELDFKEVETENSSWKVNSKTETAILFEKTVKNFKIKKFCVKINIYNQNLTPKQIYDIWEKELFETSLKVEDNLKISKLLYSYKTDNKTDNNKIDNNSKADINKADIKNNKIDNICKTDIESKTDNNINLNNICNNDIIFMEIEPPFSLVSKRDFLLHQAAKFIKNEENETLPPSLIYCSTDVDHFPNFKISDKNVRGNNYLNGWKFQQKIDKKTNNKYIQVNKKK